MLQLRTALLATTALVLVSGSALGADLPYKAAAPAPVYDWTGGYIGATVGVARLNGTCNQVDPGYGYYGACASGYYGSSSEATAATGATAGLNAGYDWQMRSFVVGVVGDWNYTNLKSSVNTITSAEYGGIYTAKVDWVASLRGRMGLAVESTMVYVTGGVAFAGLKSSANYQSSYSSPGYDVGSLNQVKCGWVAGMGVEHKFDQHWSVKSEFLYYDFGVATGASNAYEPDITKYTHEVLQAQVGVAYRF